MTGQSHLAVYDVIEIVEFPVAPMVAPLFSCPSYIFPGPSRPLFNPFMRFRGSQSTIHSGDLWERYIYSYYILGL